MYRSCALFLFLAATPLVAQWTVNHFAGDPGPSPAPLSAAAGPLALEAAGSSVVIAVPTDDVIWRIRAGGVAERIAGTGISGFSGDGGPATAAQLHGPRDARKDAAGNVYFMDELNYRIRRIDANGIITTIAGTGVPFVTGLDREGPATSRSIGEEHPIPAIRAGFGGGVIGTAVSFQGGPAGALFAVRSTGDVYFVDGAGGQYQIRRLTPAGKLELVAGVLDGCLDCSDNNRGPALAAHLKSPKYIALDGAGVLYVVESSTSQDTVRRISPDGVISKFAGFSPGVAPAVDEQPALTAYLATISDLAADTAGNVYVIQSSATQPPRLLRIGADGLIRIVAGGVFTLYVDSTGRVAYRNLFTIFDAKDGSPIAGVPGDSVSGPLQGFSRIAVSRTGELHFSEGCQIRKFNQSGVASDLALLACGSSIAGLNSLAFDSQNRLWARGAGGTFTVSPSGQVVQQNPPQNLGAAPELSIALDSEDRLHVLGPNYLNRLETNGSVLAIVRPEDNLALRAIGIDAQGNVYFAADQSGVYRIQENGTFTKIFGEFPASIATRLNVDAAGRVWRGLGFTSSAGTFYPGLRGGYAGDGGPVQSATFGSISQAELAPDGTVYVWDEARIRKLTPILQASTPVISTGGIMNSASILSGPIAPRELVAILGSQFGPPSGIQVGDAVNNVLPAAVGRTKVLFGSFEGRIAAVTPNQINVYVPNAVPVGSLVNVVVLVDDAPSVPMPVAVVERAFGLFTNDSSGSGQGAILNENGSRNGPGAPAFTGTVVTLLGTGAGRLVPSLPDGALTISTPYSKPDVPVTARIGGGVAEVVSASTDPSQQGIFQIKIRIPSWVTSGNASLSVTIGDSTTTRNVTVAVQ